MRKKRITIVLLALLLASCGNAAQNETTGSTDTAANTNTITESTEMESETETASLLAALPAADYEGYTFTIIGQHTEERPNFHAEELTGDNINDALYNRDLTVEQMYNFEIVQIADADRGKVRTTVQNCVLAQDEAHQLVLTSMADGIGSLATSGCLLDMEKLPHFSPEEAWWCRSIYENCSVDGHLYFSTGPISVSYYTTPLVMLVNQRLAGDYGLPDLYKMVDDGTWTVDAMMEMCKDVGQDLNEDGKMTVADRYGLSVECNAGNALFVSAGEQMITRTGTDTFVLSMDTDRAVDVIQNLSAYMADTNTVFVSDFTAKNAYDHRDTVFKEGRALFCATHTGGIMYTLRDMEDGFGILPMPKYEESQKEYRSYCNTWMPSGVAVPLLCSDPERSSVIIEALARESYRTVAPEVYSVTISKKVSRDEDSTRILDMVYENPFFDFNAIYDFGGTSILLRDAVCGKGDNWISTYTKKKSAAEKALTDFLTEITAVAADG